MFFLIKSLIFVKLVSLLNNMYSKITVSISANNKLKKKKSFLLILR